MKTELQPPRPRLLIVGARANSLGQAVQQAATEWDGAYQFVATAGISGEELKLDVTNNAQIKEVLVDTKPDHIVVTTGVNEPAGIHAKFLDSIMTDAFRVNVIGVMAVLRHWLELTEERHRPIEMKFVAISSNSARIPRTRSMPYCASKAALSMALRVAAREMGRGSGGPTIWGYEPGLLDTVLTRQMMLNRTEDFHRMEGVGKFGLDPLHLADRIIGDLLSPTQALNGCMIPYDAGEL